MGKLRALDLFCGGGGAALGLHWAGFETTGVDTDRKCGWVYPGEFIQADVMDLPLSFVNDYDFVWASPPCQGFSSAYSKNDGIHPKRELHTAYVNRTKLLLSNHRWTCIENVEQAPLRRDYMLTGPAVGLENIRRKRIFETSWFDLFPPIQGLEKWRWEQGLAGTVTQSLSAKSHYQYRGKLKIQEAHELMGVPYFEPEDRLPMGVGKLGRGRNMRGWQIGNAVPPRYSYYIAHSLFSYMLKTGELFGSIPGNITKQQVEEALDHLGKNKRHVRSHTGQLHQTVCRQASLSPEGAAAVDGRTAQTVPG